MRVVNGLFTNSMGMMVMYQPLSRVFYRKLRDAWDSNSNDTDFHRKVGGEKERGVCYCNLTSTTDLDCNDPSWDEHEQNTIRVGNVQQDTTAMESIAERLEDESAMPFYCVSMKLVGV